MQCGNQPFQSEAADFYMCKHIVHVRPYKVSQQAVSIHLPITRLLAGVFAFALYLFGFSLIQYLTICLFFFHRPLRTFVQNGSNRPSGCK